MRCHDPIGVADFYDPVPGFGYVGVRTPTCLPAPRPSADTLTKRERPDTAPELDPNSATGWTALTLAFHGVRRMSGVPEWKVILNWDDKGCLGPYHAGFEEHFLRARYRMVAWS